MTLTTYSRENPSPRYITLGKIYSEVHEEGGLQGDDALVGDLTPEDLQGINAALSEQADGTAAD